MAISIGEWSDPRWITVVLNSRDLNQVTWEQRERRASRNCL